MRSVTVRAVREPAGVPDVIILKLDDDEAVSQWTAFDGSLHEREKKDAEKARDEGRTPDDRRLLDVHLSIHYPQKTLDQLGLLFSICAVLALENEGISDEETKQQYYRGLLYRYGKREKAIFIENGQRIERETVKTASHMNTVELSEIIEGGFRELAELPGVSIESSAQIRNYYIEWRTWRGKLKRDGLEDTYRSLDEYRQRVPMCEACMKERGQHMAHIISKGSGGENFETWNFLHLCSGCHIYTQHIAGWIKFLRLYPHLMGKVNAARERSGLKALKKPEDLVNDIPGVK